MKISDLNSLSELYFQREICQVSAVCHFNALCMLGFVFKTCFSFATDEGLSGAGQWESVIQQHVR